MVFDNVAPCDKSYTSEYLTPFVCEEEVSNSPSDFDGSPSNRIATKVEPLVAILHDGAHLVISTPKRGTLVSAPPGDLDGAPPNRIATKVEPLVAILHDGDHTW